MAFWNSLGNLFNGLFNPFASGSPISAVSNLLNNPEESWDEFKNGKTNEVNQNIANQNLGFQRENLDYQKALQKEIFAREDTAYSRTAQDMRSAGLNPIAMNGTNGAGEVIQTDPLHNDYQHQDSGSLNALSQIFNTINQMSVTRNNASLNQAQSNLINAQAENQRIKNLYESDMLSSALESSSLSNIGKRFENERSNLAWLNDKENYDFNTKYGLTENMPDIVKLSALMSGQNVVTREFPDFKRDWNNFGKTFTQYTNSGSENYLSNQQLRGAILENQLLNGMLSLIPHGIASLFGGKK